MVSVVNMGITPRVQEISVKPDFYVIGGSQSLRRGPTAYRYGSTATIIAQIVEKENIFLLYGKSGRFGRSFFRIYS